MVDGKYIRIGRVAKYKVKNTNRHVLAYRKAIQSSNGYRASSGISVVAALVIVVGTTAVVSPAGIIAGIIAAVDVGANSTKDLYKAVTKVNLEKEEYDMTKVAGTKY